MGSTLPLGRCGKVEDVSAAVAFLANNDQAGWVTGQTLALDGGYTLTNSSTAPLLALAKKAKL